MTHEVLHGGLAGLVDALEELQDKVRVAVNDRDADVVVVLVLRQQRSVFRLIAHRDACRTHRVRVLAQDGRAGGEDVGRVELGVHRVRLTRVDHEEQLVIPGARPYLALRVAGKD